MKNQAHWSNQKEVVHSSRPIRFTIWLSRHLPHWFMMCVAFGVSVFYFLFAPRVRAYCKLYQKNLCEFYGKDFKFKKSSFKQIYAFAISFIEKIEVWLKKFSTDSLEFRKDDIDLLVESLKQKKGAFLICSHMGNMDIIRSIASQTEVVAGRKFKVVPIMDVNVNSMFTASMKQANSHIYEDFIDASNIGIEAVEKMQSTLEDGSLIFSSGDRTGANSSRTVQVPFLGKEALFPYGTFFIPTLLETDVYYMFNIRNPDFKCYSKHSVYVYKSKVNLNVPRGKRDQAIKEMIMEYSHILEELAKEHPYQWFNFFDFWNLDSAKNV